MMPVTLRGLDEARARLLDRHSRVIGWGTGSVFDYFHARHPIRLDYLVDNDPARRGGLRRGVPVNAPARLRKEDPRRTVVVVYSSSWPEIAAQIARMGPFAVVPASAAFADAAARERLAASASASASVSSQVESTSRWSGCSAAMVRRT